MDSQRSTFLFGKEEDLVDCSVVNGILFTQAGQDAPPTGVGASAWRGKMPGGWC